MANRLLPLFPLNLVVFPGEKLNLHIFEPRYRQLIADCSEPGLTFGIPAFLNDSISAIATEMRLESIEKTYPTGELDVKTRALGRVHIEHFYRQAPGKLYAAADVTDLPRQQDEDPALKARINQLIKELYAALGLQTLYLALPENYRIYDLAHHLGLSTEQEYELLRMNAESERQAWVLEHLTHVLPIILEAERLKERVRLNGHFKHLQPPNF